MSENKLIAENECFNDEEVANKNGESIREMDNDIEHKPAIDYFENKYLSFKNYFSELDLCKFSLVNSILEKLDDNEKKLVSFGANTKIMQDFLEFTKLEKITDMTLVEKIDLNEAIFTICSLSNKFNEIKNKMIGFVLTREGVLELHLICKILNKAYELQITEQIREIQHSDLRFTLIHDKINIINFPIDLIFILLSQPKKNKKICLMILESLNSCLNLDLIKEESQYHEDALKDHYTERNIDINLKSCNLGNSNLDSVTSFIKSRKAETIDLTDNVLNHNIIDYMQQKSLFNHLRQLNIECNFLCDNGVLLLLKVVNTMQILEKLNLSSNNLTEKSGNAFKDFLTNNTSLIELNLSYNELGSDGSIKIMVGLTINKTLQILNFSNNSITSLMSTDYSGGKIKNLKELVLAGNVLEDEGIPLWKLLKDNNSIIKLDVRDCCAVRGAKNILSQYLKDFKRPLQYLDLESTQLDDKFMPDLGKYLEKNPQLKWINLSCNKIGAKGISELVAKLVKNSNLEELLFNFNPLKNDGGKKIAETIKGNSGLKAIELAYTEMTSVGIEAILAELLNKPNILRLDFNGNSIDDNTITKIIELNRNITY